MSPKQDQKRVALVIGSGSIKCAAALGLWRVLERNGIKLDLVVGCSGGSIYAAGIAFDDDIATIEEATLSLWTQDLMSGYASSLRAAMTGKMRFTERSGLVDAGEIRDRIATLYGERTFAETSCPLHIVATDFMTGKPVVLSQGLVMDAIRASIAIPTVFAPYEMGGRLLTDGAVSDPLPVDVAIKEGCSIILAMGFELDYRKRMRSFNAVQSHLSAVYVNNLLRAKYAFYNLAHQGEIIPILPDFDRKIGNFDGAQLPYIIEMGEKEAESHMPYLQSLL
jgi:NTE family protein